MHSFGTSDGGFGTLYDAYRSRVFRLPCATAAADGACGHYTGSSHNHGHDMTGTKSSQDRRSTIRMKLQNLVAGILALFLSGAVVAQQTALTSEKNRNNTSALILEKEEGERRVHRPAGTSTRTAPFILKVDPQNGGSRHLIMFTEVLPPGAAIPKHKHRESEEILILLTGRSRVHLGDATKEVGPGASVFIPPDTWISTEVIGTEPVSLIAIFSEPGFEQYMRAISVREGEPNTPLSKAELDAVRARHPHAVNYE
ncbi:MAG: hypothetical protein C5B58_03820 [Acidobacteria bacterium]|nr:MAG: hypothetical protein C5B58_03820 [Acidobacteriota bacterium]